MSAEATAPVLLRIVRGGAGPDELAALAIVLLARTRTTAEEQPAQAAAAVRWPTGLAAHRPAGAWATPARPGWSAPGN